MVITLEGRCCSRRVRILIDSGASSNFISKTLWKRLPKKYRIGEKCILYINTASGSSVEESRKIPSIPFSIQNYNGFLRNTFVCYNPPKHDIVLGMSWLEQYNPTIDWKKLTISFPNENETKTIHVPPIKYKESIRYCYELRSRLVVPL